MNRRRGRLLPLTVLVGALAALIASVVWLTGSGFDRPGLTAPPGAAARDGPVRDLADADRAARHFADRWHLHVGEVMRFTRNYYAQLLDGHGKHATEVLVEPGSGAVHLEYGPAMVWNTAYGMVPGNGMTRGRAPGDARDIGPDQAVRIADQWLRDHRPGLRAAEPDAFPGYYTLHTLRDGHITGMLSVNATSGEVWYHTWHGRFLRMSPAPNR
ncbi:hypothetical protein [Streptomyces cellostaticus]|uniref:hypothetical protein n=1 Tax=Streptomyces TaxID=1883 RepID=UPI0020267334|nr:hypothetical protein [Streptomyces cellostaticus]